MVSFVFLDLANVLFMHTNVQIYTNTYVHISVAFVLLQTTRHLFSLIFRGPSPGMRGKVLLPFEDNPLAKIGVRFDKAMQDGVDFGGLCDNGYGFFCNGDI